MPFNVTAKRKSLEWLRAKSIQRILTELIASKYSSIPKSTNVWSTKQLLVSFTLIIAKLISEGQGWSGIPNCSINVNY